MAWQIPLSAVFLSKNSVESAYKNTSHELNTRISINNSVFSWCIINSTIQNNPIQKTQYETTQYKKQYETTQYKTSLRNQIKTFEITENNQNLNKNLRKKKTSEKNTEKITKK